MAFMSDGAVSTIRNAVSCVVPARWASSRFPGKMLHPLAGTPIILRTLGRAQEAGCFAEVLCLTDSEKILSIVRKAGFRAELSGPAANGTDRIARNLRTISNELIVNLQGDEPVFPVEGLRLICRALQEDPALVHVLVHDRELASDEVANPNRCKAGLDADGLVRDFYRAATRHPNAVLTSRLQMGVYAYAKPFLRRYGSLPVSPLELSESHELLRDLGLSPVKAHGCAQNSQAIDVPQDLEEAGALLLRSA
jgi:3-deoxy-manno-octulosonate cytidylyltransferase (CMP-KDO synthetase)